MNHGKQLITHVSFNKSLSPFVDTASDTDITRHSLIGRQLNFDIDTTEKLCTGYLDFENHCAHTCPANRQVDEKYEQCPECQNRTGFNPAFYNAKSVSEQQQKINQNPHALYLAYFAPNVVKVGISQAHRVKQRLLEQGARRAIILDICPTALVARQYEAKISAIPGMYETIRRQTKFRLLQTPFADKSAEDELDRKLSRIESILNLKFTDKQNFETEPYFYSKNLDLTKLVDVTDQFQLVGDVVGVVGSFAIAKYQENLLAYDLKKYIGRKFGQHDGEIELELPSEQLTLF